MIQRIQSIYLFLSFLCAGAMYILPFGSFTVAKDIWEYQAWEVSSVAGTAPFETLPVAILIGLVSLLNLVAIFLFKNRKLQNRLNVLAMLLYVAVPVLAYFYGYLAGEKLKATLQFGFAFVVPVAGIVFTFLAFKAISKDDKLVRSLDRIR